MSNDSTAPNRGLAAYDYVALGAFAAIVLPLLLTHIPPLVDYPNHLARIHILANYWSDSLLQSRYIVAPEVLPNLAIDLLATPFAMFFGVIAASKFFLALTAAVYCLGCHALRRTAVGTSGWLAIPLFFTLYSSGFLWGFINYAAGVAVFLLAFSWWLSTLDTGSTLRSLKTALSGIACYLCHLTAYGFFGVAIFSSLGYRVATGRFTVRRAFQELVPASAAVVLFILGKLQGTSDSLALRWSSPREKLTHLTVIVRSYDIGFDIAVLGTLVALAAVVYLLGARPRIASPELFWSGIALAVTYLILPYDVFARSASGVDVRLVQPAALLLILSLRFESKTRNLAPAAFAVLALVMLARHGFILYSWSSIVEESRDLESLTAEITPGSKVFVAHTLREGADEGKRDAALSHYYCALVFTKDASIPQLFTDPGGQIIRFREDPILRRLLWHNVGASEAQTLSAGYDYVVTYRELPAVAEALTNVASRSSGAGVFRLYEMKQLTR